MESNEKKERFASVKRKLNFDEDVMGMTVYEAGMAKLAPTSNNNPFLKLLDSSDSVPKFEHKNSEITQLNGASEQYTMKVDHLQ